MIENGEFRFYTDGRGEENTVKSETKWAENKLLRVASTPLGYPKSKVRYFGTMREKWGLSKDGEVLTITRWSEGPAGNVLVYDITDPFVVMVLSRAR